MSGENSEHKTNKEATNWLTVYPTEDSKERRFLVDFANRIGEYPSTKDVVLALDQAVTDGSFKGKKLKPREIELLRSVYDYTTLGVAIGFDEAVNIQNRVVTREVEKKRQRDVFGRLNQPESWSFYSGDYAGPLVGKPIDRRSLNYQLWPDDSTAEYVATERVGDNVEFMARLLEQKLDQNPDRPVVMLDVGAMYATTMLDLAEMFRQQIEEGKLVLIATSIVLDKDLISSATFPTNGTGISQDYKSRYERNNSLMHFFQADMQELQGKEINLPNNKSIHLGNKSVDIVHESWSISAHSTLLELDVGLISALMRSDGVLMSQRRDRSKWHTALSDTSLNLHGIKPSALLVHPSYSGARVDMRRVEAAEQLVASGRELNESERDLVAQAKMDRMIWDQQNQFRTHNIAGDMDERAAANLKKGGFNAYDTVVNEKGEHFQLNYILWKQEETRIPEIFDYESNHFRLASREENSKKRFFGRLRRRLGI